MVAGSNGKDILEIGKKLETRSQLSIPKISFDNMRDKYLEMIQVMSCSILTTYKLDFADKSASRLTR